MGGTLTVLYGSDPIPLNLVNFNRELMSLANVTGA